MEYLILRKDKVKKEISYWDKRTKVWRDWNKKWFVKKQKWIEDKYNKRYNLDEEVGISGDKELEAEILFDYFNQPIKYEK